MESAALSAFFGERFDFRKSDLKDNPLLVRDSATGSVDFVHRSFYEYFLANALAKRSDGVAIVLGKLRGSVADWNEWRGFSETVRFFAEALAELGKTEALEELLSERGLGSVDDLF